jgi:hypothetical protein
MAHETPEPNDPIVTRLQLLSHQELISFAEICNIEGAEELPESELFRTCNISLRYYAASSVVAVFRKNEDLKYKRILIDVADKIAEGYTLLAWTQYTMDDDSIDEDIEDHICESREN